MEYFQKIPENISFKLQADLGLYQIWKFSVNCLEHLSISEEMLFFVCFPFNCQPHKMVKHTETIYRQKPINCLSVFVDRVGLELKRLTLVMFSLQGCSLIFASHITLTYANSFSDNFRVNREIRWEYAQ